MATKKYRSGSRLILSINLSKDNRKRIEFFSHSQGGSFYVSRDKEEQDALEKHSAFNSSFVLESIIEDNVEEKVEKKEEPQKAKEIQVIKVADMGEAKEYLASTFGIARTSLRGVQAIKDQAKAYGIEFEGL
jgi:predicted RNA-binding protein YlxR (DUF448 family)